MGSQPGKGCLVGNRLQILYFVPVHSRQHYRQRIYRCLRLGTLALGGLQAHSQGLCLNDSSRWGGVQSFATPS